MSIAQLLAQILAARYGRDVRQSIHDAIGECYDDVSTAKTLADTAAANANEKATLADTKAGLADTAAANANTKATLADTKAGLADTAAANANTKATLADTKAGLADAAAINANEKATLADTKAGLANTATNNANVATTNAQAATETANTAATNANQKAELANTAAANANQKAELANTAAGSANTAASSANTAAQTANAAADNAEAKAILANNAAQYASGFTQPYIHIKYSAVQPTSNADMVDVPSDWIGLYSGNSATAPVNYTDYRWFRYKGETGEVGNHNHDTLYLGIAAKAADSDKLDGKDSTEFSDKVHTHTKSEITDFPTSMPASDVEAWAKAATKPSYDINELDNWWQRIYPVGSIYMSVSNTSPATLFGGTWAALGGRMLIGVDTIYTNGLTGGAATHTHTTPNHSHTIASHTHTTSNHNHTTAAVALTVAQLPSHNHPVRTIASATAGGVAAVEGAWKTSSGWDSSFSQATGSGATHGHGNTGNAAPTTNANTAALGTGNAAPTTNSGSSLPPYLAVHMWKRTA